ncbi:rhomboid family intramembrane serine protease [Desulfovibrio sp. OttesenSCG-928-I05]|nr:rhomboid family intramembrane serine protease [Desulfovibrio sp. OttesenSCG-928-I05]
MIFPLRDSIPHIHRPYATWGLICVTALIFIWQETLTGIDGRRVITTLGVVPLHLTDTLAAQDNPWGGSGYLSLLSYTFLHGSWWHLLSNMWYLFIFGDNIEDIMGPVRFVVFYLLCGAIAVLIHVFANAASPLPVVGASGAVSGVLGAYFLLYPHSRVTSFIFFLILRIPATVFLGGWFLLQLFSGFSGRSEGIAWWAHLGGFVAGLVLVPLFRSSRALPSELPPGGPPPPPSDPSDPWAGLRSK